MKELFYKLFSATLLAVGMILGSPVVSSITGDDTSKVSAACSQSCDLGAIWVLTIYSIDHCRCTHGGTMCCL